MQRIYFRLKTIELPHPPPSWERYLGNSKSRVCISNTKKTYLYLRHCQQTTCASKRPCQAAVIVNTTKMDNELFNPHMRCVALREGWLSLSPLTLTTQDKHSDVQLES